ncbi:MAG: C1 family peptidase [Desulfuromonadales bacterium]|nr:C1 family peptidase [Desulfuromonadales bacterium]
MTTSKTKIRKPLQSAPDIRKVIYGWLPDIPDNRDHLYGVVRKIPAKLPAKIDLRKGCSPVEDQKELGSCTANALAGALEFLMNKDKAPYVDISRLFIYYNERVMENSIRTDSGAMIRDGIKTLVKQGACSEKSWPYDITRFASKPPKPCYTEALEHQILSYARINTLDEMRACLAEGYPFVFGFSVYEGFESQQVAKTGVLDLPKQGEKMVGGHAVLGVGYDDAAKRFMVRNSWGTDWGKKGYFTMPYEYVADRNLSDDFWTIRRGKNM